MYFFFFYLFFFYIATNSFLSYSLVFIKLYFPTPGTLLLLESNIIKSTYVFLLVFLGFFLPFSISEGFDHYKLTLYF